MSETLEPKVVEEEEVEEGVVVPDTLKVGGEPVAFPEVPVEPEREKVAE